MNFVALDFETANEQRDSACAIGIAIVEDGCVIRTRYQLIRPHEIRFSAWNTRIHGITPERIADAPTLPEVWLELKPLLEDRLVIAHNASFDMSVLRHSLHANGIPIPRIQYLCSMHVARVAWPQLPSHSLTFLAAYHNIELAHHDAESDAQAAAQIVLLIADEQMVNCPFRLAERLRVTVGELLPDGNWRPSTSPRTRAPQKLCTLTLPGDFDVRTHPLYDKNVAFTGTLRFFRRAEAFKVVELLGGTPQTTVNRKTDILVTGVQDMKKLAAGETESSKLRKAKELRLSGFPIQIITDDEFYQLVFQPIWEHQRL